MSLRGNVEKVFAAIAMPTLHRHRAREQGFVLPLAMGASMVLLLGSLSAHTVSLQARMQGIREQQQRRAEDRLASAGQQLLAELHRSHPCLLALPLEHWDVHGLVCAPAPAIAALRQGQALGASYRLIDWRPQLQPAELLIELAAAGNEPTRQGAFAVQLAPAQPPTQPQPQITDVRLVGLRGVAP
ncbi:hypothetical protein Cyagr_1410 [Cyanobium gracile PCC 6307]|uniref:Uncharacterized protein n=2 Tax=Cyanobium gracile TaxID=59930 RepID=K9P6I0_CYAGP|nr:hypothetical protein Cyagr_1410 [Cyanobium gracile PCC 6307]